MEKHFLLQLSSLIRQNRNVIFSPRPKPISPMIYLYLDVIACLPKNTDFMKLMPSGRRVKGPDGIDQDSCDIWTHFNGVVYLIYYTTI
jgi:hypothetical protein